MNITSAQLRRAADLKEQIEALEAELSTLLNRPAEQKPRRKRRMSAAGRARIAVAQRARWATFHVNGHARPTHRPMRKMSAAAKARLAAIARARWRKVKAAG